MKLDLNDQYGLGGRFDRAIQGEQEPLSPLYSDEFWMEKALLASMNSIGWSAPNPGVGCVIVKENQILATGFTQAFRHEHAERIAVQSLASKDLLRGATAYVTLEPCSHFGSQPPCADLFLNSGLSRLVVAVQDPDPRVNGAGIERLRSSGIQVDLGILEREARLWHFPFLRNRIQQKPVWIGKWAQTPNAYLADRQGHSKWITNAQSRAYTHWLRQKYDAIVVGAQTYLRDQPKLNVRDCAEPIRRNPIPIVFDPKGKLLLAGFHHEASGGKVLICESSLKGVGSIPAWVKVVEGEPGHPDLIQRFQKSSENLDLVRPLQSIMVEGGASLLNLLLEQERLDALHVFTGIQEFQENDARYQIKFKPKENWSCASSHHFDLDYLQEWVKEF